MGKLLELALEHGTPREKEIARLLDDGNSRKATAAALQISEHRVRGAMSELRARAGRAGVGVPGNLPPGFTVKQVSAKLGADGEWLGGWVKSQPKAHEKFQSLTDAVSVLAEPWAKTSYVGERPTWVDSEILAAYMLGDPHLGMYAWAEEAGENFDLEIAERDLLTAIEVLVERAPPAEHALIVNLGDFLHADNPSNMTTRSGNVLDVDTRYARVYQTGIRVMKHMINCCQEKHRRITVICEIGNHDDISALTLALCLAEYYSNNDRVTIDTSPASRHWYTFGSTFIGVTHGNNQKIAELPSIMAAEQPEAWGKSKFRYWLTGHVHHDQLKEYRGCTVESFRTLAARDAWHAAKGYLSGRDMKCDIYHKDFGRIRRSYLPIAEIHAIQKTKQ